MKKKRTFLTSCDAVIEQEPDSVVESQEEHPSITSAEEMKNMLMDVINTQNQVRAGYDDLENIR